MNMREDILHIQNLGHHLKLLLKQYFHIHMTWKLKSPSNEVVNVMPFTRPCSELEKRYIYVSISHPKKWFDYNYTAVSGEIIACSANAGRSVKITPKAIIPLPCVIVIETEWIFFCMHPYGTFRGYLMVCNPFLNYENDGWAYFIYSTWVIILMLNPKRYFHMHVTRKLYSPSYWVVNAMPFTRPCSSLAN